MRYWERTAAGPGGDGLQPNAGARSDLLQPIWRPQSRRVCKSVYVYGGRGPGDFLEKILSFRPWLKRPDLSAFR